MCQAPADRAEHARQRADAARATPGPEALAHWAEVREILHSRPRIAGLAALHLEAHASPLAIAGAAPLAGRAAERIYEDGVALARELGRGLEVARIELAFAGFQLLRGCFEAARVHARRARDVADRLGARVVAARAEAALAAADLAGGFADESAPLRERLAGLEGSAEAGADAARAALLRRLAWSDAVREGPEAARRRAGEALAAARGTETEARTAAECGWLFARAGRPAEAREAARQALKALPRPDAEGAQIAAGGVLALAELESGDAEAARGAALAADDDAESCGIREDDWLPLPWIAAECLAVCGERRAARERLVRAARSRGLHDTCARRVHEARALARLGDDPGARRARERAAALRGATPLSRLQPAP